MADTRFDIYTTSRGEYAVTRTDGKAETILHRLRSVVDAEQVAYAYRQAYNLGLELAAREEGSREA